MIIKLGSDISPISKIARLAKNPKFISRFFSADEMRFFITKRFSPIIIAGNFSVKRAFVKLMGVGLRGYSLKEISVLRDSMGTPYISLSGNAKVMAEREKLSFSISISRTKDYITSALVAYRKD